MMYHGQFKTVTRYFQLFRLIGQPLYLVIVGLFGMYFQFNCNPSWLCIDKTVQLSLMNSNNINLLFLYVYSAFSVTFVMPCLIYFLTRHGLKLHPVSIDRNLKDMIKIQDSKGIEEMNEFGFLFETSEISEIFSQPMVYGQYLEDHNLCKGYFDSMHINIPRHLRTQKTSSTHNKFGDELFNQLEKNPQVYIENVIQWLKLMAKNNIHINLREIATNCNQPPVLTSDLIRWAIGANDLEIVEMLCKMKAVVTKENIICVARNVSINKEQSKKLEVRYIHGSMVHVLPVWKSKAKKEYDEDQRYPGEEYAIDHHKLNMVCLLFNAFYHDNITEKEAMVDDTLQAVNEELASCQRALRLSANKQWNASWQYRAHPYDPNSSAPE